MVATVHVWYDIARPNLNPATILGLFLDQCLYSAVYVCSGHC